MIGKIIYSLFIQLYSPAVRIISLFNDKAKLWVQGRRNIFQAIASSLANDSRNRIWIHCSSLGEFEQGRPLIESLTKVYPQYGIVLTFFSPSGYEHEKSYKGADHIFYMPLDSKNNARRFFDLIQPSLVIFIKYEFWYYYLKEAKKRNIPLLLVSAVFREGQPFFKSYGNFHRELLKCFTWLFVQNETSLALLRIINFQNASISGDTRFDRVSEVANNFNPVKGIQEFCEDKTVIVAGSTWLEDDEELDHYVNTHLEYRFIIAPHDISEVRLKECESLYHHSIRYSAHVNQSSNEEEVNNENQQRLTINLQPSIFNEEQSASDFQHPAFNTLIIDNIGMLKYLYRYATICYVGGGFGGDGVHNVLEAAVYGKPVVFGPVYEKYSEAVELEKEGAAFPVTNAIELEDTFDALLHDSAIHETASANAGKYVQSKTGATENVMQYIQANRLLTS
jgi:3-deoxy-D-manno-octulosonic-acid transferase